MPRVPPLLPPFPPATRQAVADFDARVDQAFDRLRGHPVADRVFYSASALGDHSLVWLILGALRGLRSEHDWKAAVRVGVLLGAESALVNVGIKSLFRRARPLWELDPDTADTAAGPTATTASPTASPMASPTAIQRPNRPNSKRPKLRRPLTSSFPSGHATSAFTAAGLLADDDPLWPAYYALALIVATSRVYVRVHHASDVIGGIPIGVALGRLGRRLLPLPPRPGGLTG
ncbi:MAG: hypothetical protein QOI20_140 [Acidimicrobiaceae bacterium]|jgi:undecaprenyl-diphosphatase|nr:hypothetical protein [Acidimicrobiaceae bacterium]